MDASDRPRRGGPRTFDRDEALEVAMRLFWRCGYEGVSISDLTGAMGIAPPSLYAAFGNKAGLYKEALDRYASLRGAPEGSEEADNLADAVATLLQAAVKSISNPQWERGCMISTGMVQCADEHEDIARDLIARRGAVRDGIARTFSRWLDGPKADSLARYCSALMQGLAVQARDGANGVQLAQVVDEAIAGIKSRYF